jgi:hypothetical protein
VPDQRHGFAGLRVQRDVMQHRHRFVVGEADILKAHVAGDLDRLIVLDAARFDLLIENLEDALAAARPDCTSWFNECSRPIGS